MLDTAGPAAAAASTGAKKATLQKLMSFDMMEPGYPMDEEMMLEDEEEDEDLVFNEDYLEGITSCNKVSVTSNSMARANLNKSEWLVTNSTAASKFMPKRPGICII